MIKFDEIKYERVDFDVSKDKLVDLINKFSTAKNSEEAVKYYKEIIVIQNHVEEMNDLADIRNMRDDSDLFYTEEIKYWNSFKPKFDLLFIPFYKAILSSPYLDELTKLSPSNFFNSITYQLRLTNEDVVSLQERENELKTMYLNIIRKPIEYNGETIKLAGFSKYFNSFDRKVREDAHNRYNDFFYENIDELDNIFEELIKVRNEIAKKCGFDSYADYSIYSLRRFGYDYEDIKAFRDNIIKYTLDLVDEIKETQKKNLGVDELKYYDTVFFSNPPKPLYEGEKLIEEITKVFYSIDNELGKFFEEYLKCGYFDLLSRDTKVNFGITNYLSSSKMPTITANFRNTIMDVMVTEHEAGHAFQKYNAALEDEKYVVSSLLKYPTFEIAEMFSNALQLIGASRSKSLFTDEDYKKYLYISIKDMITTLPYIALIDEFQETIYKSGATKESIHATWIELVKKYRLEINNSGHINLDNGGYFYRQSHIFTNPFYYIDYALSYFGAIAIWSSSTDNLNVFKEASKVASYYPLKELIDKFDIANPFDEESMKSAIDFLKLELTNKTMDK